MNAVVGGDDLTWELFEQLASEVEDLNFAIKLLILLISKELNVSWGGCLTDAVDEGKFAGLVRGLVELHADYAAVFCHEGGAVGVDGDQVGDLHSAHILENIAGRADARTSSG